MKTAFFFDIESDGGGIFQHTKRYINSVLKLGLSDNELLIIVNSKKISSSLKEKNIDHLLFDKNKFSIKLFFFLFNISFLKILFNKFNIINPFENFIKKKKIDLVIFNSPSYYIFYCKKINYIFNIWNTEIKFYNFFPEFKKNLAYENQNSIIQEAVNNAFKIVVFTRQNRTDLKNLYSCDDSKIVEQIMIPNLPKIYEENRNYDFSSFFSSIKINLKNQKVFLYPAQYYAHKNHKYLIEAISILKKNTKQNFLFIFTGIDKGNLLFLKNLVSSSNLNNEIKFYENIDDFKLISLYLGCDALISSTYLGRISLPLLEGFYFKKPIFYSKGILDVEFEKRIYPFDLKDTSDFSSKIISFFNKELNEDQFINSNKKYYDLSCNDEIFKNNYLKIITEYEFYHKKWKK
jgi:hypothetical protein